MKHCQENTGAALAAKCALALAVLCTVMGPLAHAADDGFHARNPREGWFWYEVQPVLKELPNKPPATASVAAPVVNRDLAAFKDFQRRMEESLQMAVINPTDANVLNYLTLWQESKQKASVFTDTAQAVAWRTPSVNDDFLGVRPTSPTATQVFDMQKEEAQASTVATLARTHGMFFFFRSDCPYCHAMAPMLKQFGQKYGMTIYPVSMDGGGLPEYPNAQRDNGIAARLISELGIPPEEFQVPFTVLARPGTREVLPVGFGVMTAAEMVERIDMVMKLRAQQRDETKPAAGTPARSRPMGPSNGVSVATAGSAASTTRVPLVRSAN